MLLSDGADQETFEVNQWVSNEKIVAKTARITVKPFNDTGLTWTPATQNLVYEEDAILGLKKSTKPPPRLG